MSEIDPTMKRMASTAGVGLVATERRSLARRDGNALSAIDVPPDTRKIPMTDTYIVMHSGQALPMTKNDALAQVQDGGQGNSREDEDIAEARGVRVRLVAPHATSREEQHQHDQMTPPAATGTPRTVA